MTDDCHNTSTVYDAVLSSLKITTGLIKLSGLFAYQTDLIPHVQKD